MDVLISGKYKMIIDEECYEKIAGYSLHVNSKGYAEVRFTENKKLKSILIHRVVVSAGKNEIVDHVNGNTLDNRKENLRIVTRNQNMQNCKTYKSSSTGFKGVSWHSSAKKYIARIQVNKSRMIIGYYDDINDAILARKEASKKYHGEYSGRLSFEDNSNRNAF